MRMGKRVQIIDRAVVLDCEFLTDTGAPGRFWCGPRDPDPIVFQIGAVALSLTGDFAIDGTFHRLILPVGRDGQEAELSELAQNLTGISNADLQGQGVSLAQAYDDFAGWLQADKVWSWGKDELNLMAISSYVAGIAPPVPVTRFDNACRLLLKAGMPYEDLAKTRSNTLAAYFDLDTAHLRGHDARDDAMSVALTLQHLLRQGRLLASDFT